MRRLKGKTRPIAVAAEPFFFLLSSLCQTKNPKSVDDPSELTTHTVANTHTDNHTHYFIVIIELPPLIVASIRSDFNRNWRRIKPLSFAIKLRQTHTHTQRQTEVRSVGDAWPEAVATTTTTTAGEAAVAVTTAVKHRRPWSLAKILRITNSRRLIPFIGHRYKCSSCPGLSGHSLRLPAPKLVRTPPQTGTGKGNGIGEVAGAGAGQQIYRNF